VGRNKVWALPPKAARAVFTVPMWTQADIEAWRPELKPLSLNKTETLQAALSFFRDHMLNADVRCPMGCQLALTPGHFFPLTCRSIGGKKGYVDSAKSMAHAFDLIESGVVEISGVPGCEHQRVRDLALLLDVVTTPHFITEREKGGRRIFLKRYESPQLVRPRAKIAILVLSSNGKLKPASFYTKEITADWLNSDAPVVIWKKNEG
jgi:hypothetical protein